MTKIGEHNQKIGLSKKMTCLRGLQAAKPRSRNANINCGFMSKIVYEQSLEAEINFLNKIQFSRFLGFNFKEIRLFLTIGNFWVNTKDLGALTLVGPTREDSILDPLAVLHLNNWLSMFVSVIS